MVWFYFLLLIPLISALRRLDEPNEYDVLRGNKPILRMASDADYSKSGTYRPYMKRHGKHRNKNAILGEDRRTRPPPQAKAPGLVTDWDRFVKWLLSNSKDASMPRGYTIMDGSAEKENGHLREKFVPPFPDPDNYSSSEEYELHMHKSSQNNTFYEPTTAQGEFIELQFKQNHDEGNSQPPKTETSGLLSQWDRLVKWVSSMHSKSTPLQGEDRQFPFKHYNDEVTSQPPESHVTYVHQEHGGWKEKLWWLFFGAETPYPKHTGRTPQVYEGVKEDGKLVLLRKISKDIDFSELDPIDSSDIL